MVRPLVGQPPDKGAASASLEHVRDLWLCCATTVGPHSDMVTGGRARIHDDGAASDEGTNMAEAGHVHSRGSVTRICGPSPEQLRSLHGRNRQ